MTRVCRKCGVEQPLENFGKHPRSSGGRIYHCYDCVNARRRERLAAFRNRRPGEPRAYICVEVGDVFGELTAVERLGKDRQGRRFFRFSCSCGGEKIARNTAVSNGRTRHCGCLRGANLIKPDFGAAITRIYGSYVKGAENRKLPFALTKEQVSEIVRQPCYYCGAEGCSFTGPPSARLHHNGIDRLDSSKGYTLDNVVTSCTPCNFSKQTLSRAEFIALAIRVAERHGPKP